MSQTTNGLSPTLTAAHCQTLIAGMQSFYRNPANQAEFEKWHTEKYGHPPRKTSYIQPNPTGEVLL